MDESDNFSTRRLITFGILANRRETFCEAEALWHLYDLNCDNFLSKPEAFKMATEITTLAIEFPIWASDYYPLTTYSINFLQRLRPRAEMFVEEVLTELFGPRC
jgi:hypothetical protein